MMRFIILNILFLFLAAPVWSKNFSVSDKTFFSERKLDRIYFDPDGHFVQQLEDKFDAIGAGELLRGTWKFNEFNQELCMSYTQPQLNMICFDIIANLDAPGYSVYDRSGKQHFIWNYMYDGNWMLSMEGMSMIKNALEERSIPTSSPLDTEAEGYYLGKIFSGFDNILSYFVDSKTMIYRDSKTKEKVSLRYKVENLRTQTFDENNNSIEDVLVTLGNEFLEEKETQAYFYSRPDLFYIEGQGKFDLTPIAEHPEKNFFLN